MFAEEAMTNAKNILIVEDETDLLDLISFNLEREGFVCRRAADGESALVAVAHTLPDLVILDRMLPKRSGDDVIAALRRDARTASVPVIMLTAKADEADELVGFAMGADDYVTKPFSMKALIARVNAMMRRTASPVPGSSKAVYRTGPVKLDVDRHEVTVDGRPVSLTTTEFRLLKALIRADGRLKSRAQLIDEALGQDVAVVDRTIDVHVAALRKKLGTGSRWIRTIRGAGYTWRQPASIDT